MKKIYLAAVSLLLIGGCGDGSETESSTGPTNSFKTSAEIACFDKLSAINSQAIDLSVIETGLYSKKATTFPGVLFDISTGKEIQIEDQTVSQLSDSSYVHLETNEAGSLQVTYINPRNLAAEFPFIDYILERDPATGEFFGKYYPVGGWGLDGLTEDDPYVLIKLTSLSSSELSLEACYPYAVFDNYLQRASSTVDIDFVAPSESTYSDLKRVVTETIEATTLIPEQVITFSAAILMDITSDEYSTFRFTNSSLLPIFVTAEVTDTTVPTELGVNLELNAFDQSFISASGADGDLDTPARYLVSPGETFYFEVTAKVDDVESEDYDPNDTITVTLRQSYSGLNN